MKRSMNKIPSAKRIRLSMVDACTQTERQKPNLRIIIPALSPKYCGVSPQYENYESPLLGSPVHPSIILGTPDTKCDHEWTAAERAMNERTTYFCTKCGDIYGFP